MGIISVMPNTGLAIELQPAERTQLEQWESAHGTPQQVALRCRIILRAVAGKKEERESKEKSAALFPNLTVSLLQRDGKSPNARL
jgi:hypothetical protein